MAAIEGYVDAHLAETVTLHSVARLFQVSISTVTQQFQRRSGITFHQYLTQRRMEQASTLIREDTALEEVGKLVGYVDHSTFYRAFRQTFGMSPAGIPPPGKVTALKDRCPEWTADFLSRKYNQK